MGRPLSNAFFGNSVSGYTYKLANCWIKGEVSSNTTSSIIRQVGLYSYQVKNTTTNVIGVVNLVSSITAAGQGIFQALTNSGLVNIKTITADHLIDFTNTSYVWMAGATTVTATTAIVPVASASLPSAPTLNFSVAGSSEYLGILP